MKKKSTLLPEGVYGITSSKSKPSKQPKRVSGPKISLAPKKKTVKRIKVQPKILPGLDIDYEAFNIPEEAKGLDLRNRVDIPEEFLRTLKARTQARSRSLSNLLVSSVTPSLLSFDASMTYMQTVLSRGFKIDVDVDSFIFEYIKDITRLDVIVFYLKRLKAPQKVKQYYIERFIDKLLEHSTAAATRVEKEKHLSKSISEIEGVLVKGYSQRQQKNNEQKADDDKSSKPGRGTVKRRGSRNV